jgi:hypothetical protein
MTLHLTLERDALSNDDDPAGRWQYEGGRVFERERQAVLLHFDTPRKMNPRRRAV